MEAEQASDAPYPPSARLKLTCLWIYRSSALEGACTRLGVVSPNLLGGQCNEARQYKDSDDLRRRRALERIMPGVRGSRGRARRVVDED